MKTFLNSICFVALVLLFSNTAIAQILKETGQPMHQLAEPLEVNAFQTTATLNTDPFDGMVVLVKSKHTDMNLTYGDMAGDYYRDNFSSIYPYICHQSQSMFTEWAIEATGTGLYRFRSLSDNRLLSYYPARDELVIAAPASNEEKAETTWFIENSPVPDAYIIRSPVTDLPLALTGRTEEDGASVAARYERDRNDPTALWTFASPDIQEEEGLADLIVSNVMVHQQSGISNGSALPLIEITVENVGSGTALGTDQSIPEGGYMIDIILSDDNQVPLDYADVPEPYEFREDMLLLGGRISNTITLQPGQGHTYTIEGLQMPDLLNCDQGWTHIIALVNAGQRITESNYNNNTNGQAGSGMIDFDCH